MGKRFTVPTAPLRAGFRLCLKRSMPERSPDNYFQASANIQADRLCVHHTALIAASATLQATLPYCIEIGAGVVIGEGCWLQACSGDIIIESGAVLGVGVLIVGWSEIGTFSLVGSGVTLFEVAIESGTAIAAHSVRGLPTRDLPQNSPLTETTNEVDNLPDPWDEHPSSIGLQDGMGAAQTQPLEPEPIRPEFKPESITPEPIQPEPIQPIHSGVTIQPQARPGLNTPGLSTPLQINHPSTSTPFIRSWKRPPAETQPEPSPATRSSTSPAVADRSSPQANQPPEEASTHRPAEEPPCDQPSIESTIDPAVVPKPTSQTTNVYGRQHVNRIIDSILRRNTPEV